MHCEDVFSDFFALIIHVSGCAHNFSKFYATHADAVADDAIAKGGFLTFCRRMLPISMSGIVLMLVGVQLYFLRPVTTSLRASPGSIIRVLHLLNEHFIWCIRPQSILGE
ncbi:hypothetical protein [Xanthomonas sp. LMG 9002]|uniref:hypothetical protein n=1 Tax=Xanthomonas sp. LMG 9002 TaxID=1591158 RepID=UPI00136D192F|nr:hypothetical protein [Xanthomonas sp. LMG 9002]